MNDLEHLQQKISDLELEKYLLTAQVEAMRSWADELESENPSGVGQFIALELRNRLDAAKPTR